jgi:hypothetical protein
MLQKYVVVPSPLYFDLVTNLLDTCTINFMINYNKSFGDHRRLAGDKDPALKLTNN